jgi:hypothetical protein
MDSECANTCIASAGGREHMMHCHHEGARGRVPRAMRLAGAYISNIEETATTSYKKERLRPVPKANGVLVSASKTPGLRGAVMNFRYASALSTIARNR